MQGCTDYAVMSTSAIRGPLLDSARPYGYETAGCASHQHCSLPLCSCWQPHPLHLLAEEWQGIPRGASHGGHQGKSGKGTLDTEGIAHITCHRQASTKIPPARVGACDFRNRSKMKSNKTETIEKYQEGIPVNTEIFPV